jgi:hypothetical protein
VSESKSQVKPFVIDKWMVWEAYQRVKANQGAAGVDGCTIEQFEQDLKNNLYKLWNRLSSGSYFPPPVKAVAIPKAGEGPESWGCPPSPTGSPRRWQPCSWSARWSHCSTRLLRLSPRAVGVGCGGGLPGALLAKRLGD